MTMDRPTDEAPASIGLKLHQAVALHQRGQLSGAKCLYQDILSEHPRHFDALHLLGVIAAVTGELERAVDLMGRAIEIDPNREAAHNNRGNALLELGRSEAALAEFDRAIELKRDYTEAHFNRANALRDLKRWDAALAGYDRALELRRDYPEAWSN